MPDPVEPEAAEPAEEGEEETAQIPFDSEGLTDDQKAEILEKFNEGQPPTVNTPTLAKDYGVSIKTIWGIIKNRPK